MITDIKIIYHLSLQVEMSIGVYVQGVSQRLHPLQSSWDILQIIGFLGLIKGLMF